MSTLDADGQLRDTPLDQLREADDNPRDISDERFDALKYALERDPAMLRARPLIADVSGDGPPWPVVCGNMRLRAAHEIGWDAVPVYFKRFESDAQRRAWMLRDNQEFGEWVPDELAAIVAQAKATDDDMALLGFREPEIEALLAHHREPEFAPAPGDDQGQLDKLGKLRCPECGHEGDADAFRP